MCQAVFWDWSKKQVNTWSVFSKNLASSEGNINLGWAKEHFLTCWQETGAHKRAWWAWALQRFPGAVKSVKNEERCIPYRNYVWAHIGQRGLSWGLQVPKFLNTSAMSLISSGAVLGWLPTTLSIETLKVPWLLSQHWTWFPMCVLIPHLITLSFIFMHILLSSLCY